VTDNPDPEPSFPRSLDHVVGAQEKRRRSREAEGLGGLEVIASSNSVGW